MLPASVCQILILGKELGFQVTIVSYVAPQNFRNGRIYSEHLYGQPPKILAVMKDVRPGTAPESTLDCSG